MLLRQSYVNVAMTYGYEDICKKPFRKISERTVGHF